LEIGKIFRVTRGEDEGGARGISFGESGKKLIHQNEWFTKTIRVRLVRQLARISPQDTRLANGGITVKGHPSLKADISLSAAQTGSRGAGAGSDFYRALERQGLELLNFSGTRGGAEGVLELTDIRNPEAIRDQPLEIELDLKLSEDEYVLPLTFDGEHILLAGEPEKDVDGRTLIHIDHFPDGVPDQRRSLGKALKLYFFKTYLKRTDVNQLCWVEYTADSSVERHAEGVADKVAAASNILLLVHGIIGDTEGMAKGLRLATDATGTGVDARFDLVLTYDYENLSTSIQDTARQLGKQLSEVGLHAQDDKRLTLLVHSMGGLVARWFIEQEGGNRVVDHLVMCGTPNVGSPFGKIDSARNLTSVLTTWAMNSFPAFAPFGAGLLAVLGRSKKISPCLEQMNPGSELIRELNASNDPVVRYSILAGDIRDYQEESDALLAKLTAKIGKGALFDALYRDAGHDIAVSLASIQGVPDARQPAPLKREVGCHHLNYFASAAGLRALVGVGW
jgi:pimeloyl-ACP methyl ester carboxylesterase